MKSILDRLPFVHIIHSLGMFGVGVLAAVCFIYDDHDLLWKQTVSFWRQLI